MASKKNTYSLTYPAQVMYDSVHHYIYVVGYTMDTVGIASIGAHQDSYYVGNSFDMTADIFLSKWDTLGNRIWGTYFGGEGADWVTNLDLDNEGNIIITGFCSSDTNMTTSGAFQEYSLHIPFTTTNPNNFLAKFSPDGTLLWSTYFGLGGNNLYSGLKVDKTSNSIYITGSFTNTGLMATTGAYQAAYYGGTTDGFIAKFDAMGNRIWCTYFGGENADFISNIELSEQGYLYICGITRSSVNIASSGAAMTVKPTDTFSSSGFLAKFDTLGNRIWSTYLGGNAVSDYFFDIKTISSLESSEENVYIYGRVQSTNLATVGTHKPVYAGGVWDMILLKYNESGNKIWGTYIGGSDRENSYLPSVNTLIGFTSSLDINGAFGSEELLIVGGTKSADFDFDDSCTYLPGSSNKKGFISALDYTGNLRWSKPFDEGINSISRAGKNEFYITGATNIDGLATFGAHRETKATASLSGFIAKIDLNPCLQSSFEISKIGDVLHAPNGYFNHQWFRNNVAIPGAIADSLLVDLVDSGYFTVTFFGECNCNYVSQIYNNNTTSIYPNLNKIPVVSIYPNPTSESINIDYQNSVKILSIHLVDVYGRVIRIFKKNEKTLDLSRLPNGVYYLNITAEGGNVTKKIIVK